jgi:arylsulfatase A-like enzyme
MKPMYWKNDATRDGAHWVDQWGPEHEADMAIQYIKNEDGKLRNTDSPFALVVSMNPPHMPYSHLPKKYVRRYAGKTLEDLCNRPDIPSAEGKWGKYYRQHIRNYLAMVTGVDEQFGRILDALEEQGLDRDTIVLFTSDHGNCLGIHDQVSKNNHYEESMRVPFILRWKGTIKPRKDDLLISSPDIYPTLLDLMGFKGDIPEQVEGRSHAPLILTAQGRRPESQLYIWVPYGKPEWGRRGIRTHRYTLMISMMPDEPSPIILHDNIRDRYQMENAAAKQPDVVKRLIKDELIPWLEKTRDPWLFNFKKGAVP